MARARLVVDARLLHYNQAGIGRYLLHLYRAMAALPAAERSAFDVTMLYSRKDHVRALHDCWPQDATAWTPPHNRFERWALAAELAVRRPGLVHSPDHVAPQTLGWRSVVTVHDLAFRRMPDSHALESRAYYTGLERSVRQAARVICVSEATRRDLLEVVPECKPRLQVVPEAPDAAYSPNGPVHEQDRPYFVFTGTIEPRKNVAGIVQALAALPAASRPQLVVIGAQGSAYAAVSALVTSLGLKRDVLFAGRLRTEEVAARYRGALALVFPSFMEGFGLPILEAMACGTPVITSDRSSMVEVAGGAALLVNPDDPTSISNAMNRIAADSTLRQDLRTRGLARAATFSWARAASQTLAVFREALS